MKAPITYFEEQLALARMTMESVEAEQRRLAVEFQQSATRMPEILAAAVAPVQFYTGISQYFATMPQYLQHLRQSRGDYIPQMAHYNNNLLISHRIFSGNGAIKRPLAVLRCESHDYTDDSP